MTVKPDDEAAGPGDADGRPSNGGLEYGGPLKPDSDILAVGVWIDGNGFPRVRLLVSSNRRRWRAHLIAVGRRSGGIGLGAVVALWVSGRPGAAVLLLVGMLAMITLHRLLPPPRVGPTRLDPEQERKFVAWLEVEAAHLDVCPPPEEGGPEMPRERDDEGDDERLDERHDEGDV